MSLTTPTVNSAEIREALIETLIEDLIGPLDDRPETLDVAPSRFYLTGFLASCNGSRQVEKPPATQATLFEIAEDEDDQDTPEDPTDKDAAPDPGARKVGRLPSSLGLSLLLPPGATHLTAEASWADYMPDSDERDARWIRTFHTRRVEVPLGKHPSGHMPVPDSNGLEIHWAQRPFNTDGSGLEAGTLSVAVFLVNARPIQDGPRDLEFAFQAQLALERPEGFVPRPDWHARTAEERDSRIADLQYRDEREWAVGHGVAAEARLDEDGCCRRLKTAWVPSANVEKVEPAKIEDVELKMEALADMVGADALLSALMPLVTRYGAWIDTQAAVSIGDSEREDTKNDLIVQMRNVRTRIQRGILALEDPTVREAFQLANRAMANAGRQRALVTGGSVIPTWRPFQLAFILMALPGLIDPTDPEREIVDLLFFPTGGGKTEAYLGLAAITLIHRRFRHPETSGAGVSVLMRYTLRLLTLDQLGRATALICALELMRRSDPERLGDWPFEIGLWIGQGGTPNRLGKKGEASEHSAYTRLRRHQSDPKRFGAPMPLAVCPWCDTRLNERSFVLVPATEPRRLRVRCGNLQCAFGLDGLPLVGVDEEVYRRLPGFIIATVDKFAALPWEGRAGTLFGLVERQDADGFYGPCDEGYGRPLPGKRLAPPDLVIQDELHLISGPLGTMVGLYESAIEELCSRQDEEGRTIRPKIVASTATVRRAESQIQGLFGRSGVTVFPPPGPDRKHSFFAVTRPANEVPARRYIGISARGRSFKVVQLRVGIALLAAAYKLYERHRGASGPNPADPYMTLLAYFGSLRELGGARRIYEDEVKKRVEAYSRRTKNDGQHQAFLDRKLGEIAELTSRVSTAEVAEAKDKLSRAFETGRSVDVALATNMIAVGLDISRLGLMIITGQPISTSEYIQATSRVGRDETRPGLVVTLFNPMRPRDRSHYERFTHFHHTFYRLVETTSVTPFSLRALDRGLAGALVGLIRHAEPGFAKPDGFKRARNASGRLKVYAQKLSRRASASQATEIEDRIKDLIDDWDQIATSLEDSVLFYNKAEARGGSVLGVLHEPTDPPPEGLPPQGKKFRAQRSLRDVETVSNVWLKVIGQRDFLEEDEDNG